MNLAIGLFSTLKTLNKLKTLCGVAVIMQPPQDLNQQQYAQPQYAQQQQYVQPQVVGQPVMMQQIPGTISIGAFPQTQAQLALILSIVSIFLGGICLAIPSLILANGALNITRQFPGHPDEGSAKTAQVISWIVIGLFTLVILFYVVMIGMFASSGY